MYALANSFDTEAPHFGLNLFIANGILLSMINDLRDGFNFVIVNFTFLNGDVLRCIYISQLVQFARVCSNVSYFINRNQVFTAKLL